MCEAKKITFTDLDNSNKSSFHAGGQWTATINGKTYIWNYVYVKDGKWNITNKPEKAEAIAVSTKAGKKLKTAEIIRK